MAIISGYKSKREKDGEIREIGGKKKEEEEEEENLYVGLHCTHKKRDGTGERDYFTLLSTLDRFQSTDQLSSARVGCRTRSQLTRRETGP
jgi:hypothetical protein